MLKDKNGHNLEDGIYIGPDPVNKEANIYLIHVKRETFSAEYWDGFLNITNFEEAATNFIRLGTPPTNCRFLESKIK